MKPTLTLAALLALAACQPSVTVNDSPGAIVILEAGQSARTVAGGDVSGSNTTADNQANPTVSLWP